MDKEVKKLMAIHKMLGNFKNEDSICLALGINEIKCPATCKECQWNSGNYGKENG